MTLLYNLIINLFPSWSYFATLNSYNFLRLFKGVCTFRIYNSFPYTYYISTTYISFSLPLMNIPSKNTYKSWNKPYKGM